MSTVRVPVGTRKGAFILTADGKREQWEVSGPVELCSTGQPRAAVPTRASTRAELMLH